MASRSFGIIRLLVVTISTVVLTMTRELALNGSTWLASYDIGTLSCFRGKLSDVSLSAPLKIPDCGQVRQSVVQLDQFFWKGRDTHSGTHRHACVLSGFVALLAQIKCPHIGILTSSPSPGHPVWPPYLHDSCLNGRLDLLSVPVLGRTLVLW